MAPIRSTISAGSRRRNGGNGIGSGMRGFRLCGCGADSEERRRPDAGIQQTAGVPTFTLYVALRAERGVDDGAVDALAQVVRPEVDELCIWRDGALVRISVDCSADDLHAALDLGHDLAAEAVEAGVVPLVADEVAAMGDERQLVWRREP